MDTRQEKYWAHKIHTANSPINTPVYRLQIQSVYRDVVLSNPVTESLNVTYLLVKKYIDFSFFTVGVNGTRGSTTQTLPFY